MRGLVDKQHYEKEEVAQITAILAAFRKSFPGLSIPNVLKITDDLGKTKAEYSPDLSSYDFSQWSATLAVGVSPLRVGAEEIIKLACTYQSERYARGIFNSGYLDEPIQLFLEFLKEKMAEFAGIDTRAEKSLEFAKQCITFITSLLQSEFFLPSNPICRESTLRVGISSETLTFYSVLLRVRDIFQRKVINVLARELANRSAYEALTKDISSFNSQVGQLSVQVNSMSLPERLEKMRQTQAAFHEAAAACVMRVSTLFHLPIRMPTGMSALAASEPARLGTLTTAASIQILLDDASASRSAVSDRVVAASAPIILKRASKCRISMTGRNELFGVGLNAGMLGEGGLGELGRNLARKITGEGRFAGGVRQLLDRPESLVLLARRQLEADAGQVVTRPESIALKKERDEKLAAQKGEKAAQAQTAAAQERERKEREDKLAAQAQTAAAQLRSADLERQVEALKAQLQGRNGADARPVSPARSSQTFFASDQTAAAESSACPAAASDGCAMVASTSATAPPNYLAKMPN